MNSSIRSSVPSWPSSWGREPRRGEHAGAVRRASRRPGRTTRTDPEGGDHRIILASPFAAMDSTPGHRLAKRVNRRVVPSTSHGLPSALGNTRSRSAR